MAGSDNPDDAAAVQRQVMHFLQYGLMAFFEYDPDRPVFHRMVSPTRKYLGDNPDALYYDAPVNPARVYRVRGNIAGAVYTSFTVETGNANGHYSTGTAGALNDEMIDVSANGEYEIILGGDERDRNWLGLPPDAGRITTRHYFEEPEPVAADPNRHVPLTIEPLESPGPPPAPSAASVAQGLKRVTNFVRERTIDRQPPPAVSQAGPPDWVSPVPNTFRPPQRPGEMGFAAFDAAYSSAPYQLAPEEALVITGRWPKCRFGNVVLWNRLLQTNDYVHRSVSRNRASTVPEPDGSFRLVVAHEDPGVPNWLDTEGKQAGTIFWRFFLPDGDIETPQATVVKAN